MKDKLIKFETAVLAEEKNFDITNWDLHDSKTYNEEGKLQLLNDTHLGITYYLAPTQSLLQKWLRDIHDIDITVMISGATGHEYYVHDKNRLCIGVFDVPITAENVSSHYEATLEEALQKALELIK